VHATAGAETAARGGATSVRGRPAHEVHTRRFWEGTPRMSSAHAALDDWLSRAALYLILYDEVEAQTSGGFPSPDEALFSSRLAGSGSRRRERQVVARPTGVAHQTSAQQATIRAWDALGLGGLEDEEEALSAFMVDEEDADEEERASAGEPPREQQCTSTQAAYMAMQLEDGSDEEEGEDEDSEDEREEWEAQMRRWKRMYGSEHHGDADVGSDSEGVEYRQTPDALELAEEELKRRRRQRKQEGAATQGRSGGSEDLALKRRRVISDDDEPLHGAAAPVARRPRRRGRGERLSACSHADDDGALKAPASDEKAGRKRKRIIEDED